jgi:hypothetical protein
MWRMVKYERARNPEEGTLEVLRRMSGSEKKKNCWMASLLNFLVEQKLTWIQALTPLDIKFISEKHIEK